MAFVITKDHLEENRSQGVIGPRDYYNNNISKFGGQDSNLIDHIKKSGKHFRMYDDDGELYYEGYFLHHSTESSEFEPLECFGTPNAGCTEIRYRNPSTNKYETL